MPVERVSASTVPVVDARGPALILGLGVSPIDPLWPMADIAADALLTDQTSVGVAGTYFHSFHSPMPAVRVGHRLWRSDFGTRGALGLSLGLGLSAGAFHCVEPACGQDKFWNWYWVQPALTAGAQFFGGQLHVRGSVGPTVGWHIAPDWIPNEFALIPNLELAWRYHPNWELTLLGYSLIGIRAIVPIEPRREDPFPGPYGPHGDY